jgi:N-acylneuraminate cytidylyltransferase
MIKNSKQIIFVRRYIIMRLLAIIPARGGSKGILRKNVRKMVGQPLITYSIKNAISSVHNLDVVVSTDDDEIARISSFYGAKVIKRPEDLATDGLKGKLKQWTIL